MSQPDKSFAHIYDVTIGGSGGGALSIKHVVLDPTNTAIAGSPRLVASAFDYGDSLHEIYLKVADAVRIDMNDPSLEVVILGSRGAL